MNWGRRMLSVCAALLSLAGLSGKPAVEDRWDVNRQWTVSGDNWRSVIDGNTSSLLLEKQADGQTQLIRLGFGDGTGGKAEIRSLAAVSGEDPGKMKVEVTFSVEGEQGQGLLIFQPDGMVSFVPPDEMVTIQVEGDIRRGLLPGFSLDDIFYNPQDLDSGVSYHVPSERAVAGLLGDGEGLFALTWEPGGQRVAMTRSIQGAEPVIQWHLSLEGKPVYIGLSVAKGIWNHETISGDATESSGVRLAWQRPFEGNWRTALIFRGVESDLAIPKNRINSWRSTFFPLWFNDKGETFVRLGERFQLKEESLLIYLFNDDPRSLMALLRSTPEGGYFDGLLKKEAPYPGSGKAPFVGFTACWGTDLLRESILISGAHYRDRAYLNEWIDAVTLHHVVGTQRRRAAHYEVILGLNRQIREWMAEETGVAAHAYLQAMLEEVETLEGMYHDLIRRDGEDSPEAYVRHIEELGERMRLLLETPGMEFVVECDAIVNRMNHVTWAQMEHTGGMHGGGFGHQWRVWYRNAGELCAEKPEALKYAESIRETIRQHLRKRLFETMSY